ncbi:hypothetical protein Golax_004240, partial [Gossypium laxum]|nr:hypothetical protein [Gossypium laxum]
MRDSSGAMLGSSTILHDSIPTTLVKIGGDALSM